MPPRSSQVPAGCQAADLGLEHVLVAELVVGLVDEHVVGDALGERALRLDHLREERVFVRELLRDDVPGLELLGEDRLRACGSR